MTTAQTLKLVRGSASIDLTTAPYAIGRDFEIPELVRTSIVAEGSSANIYGGGVRTYVKYHDREWSFEIRVNADSDAAVKIAARRVSDFLLGINSNDKTYLEYRANSDTLAPIWGVHGSPLRFEIVDGTARVWPEYAQYNRRGTETFMTINVTIKPFATTSKIRVCTATGGILEDTLGSSDGSARGVRVLPATVNLVKNPSGEADSNYAALNAATMTHDTDAALYGAQSYKVVTTAATADGASFTLYACANAIHYATLHAQGEIPESMSWSLDGATWNSPTLIDSGWDDELFDDFERADGALGTAPTGQAWDLSYQVYGTAAITSGRFTASFSNYPGGCYGYITTTKTPTRMEAEFSYNGGSVSNGDTMTLISSQVPNRLSDMVHFLVWEAGWAVQVRQNSGSFVNILSGSFAIALSAGPLYRMAIEFNGNTATVYLPDGTVRQVTDSRVGALAGPYLCYEIAKPASTYMNGRFEWIGASTKARVRNWMRYGCQFPAAQANGSTTISIRQNYAIAKTFRLDGLQVQQSATPTIYTDGDQLGSIWNGAVHGDLSTRTAGKMSLPIAGLISPSAGSVRMEVEWEVGSTFATSQYFFDTMDGTHAGGIYAYYEQALDKIVMSNNTQTALSAALNWAPRQRMILHFTWGPEGFAIYKDGVLAGSVASLEYPMAANIFFGSNYSGGLLLRGLFGLALFDRQLTATEVSNDYANISSTVSDGIMLDTFPWFWTDDGDNILSLDTGKQALGIVGGVPGSAPAITEIQGTLSSNWSTIKSILLGNFASSIYLSWSTFWYNTSGTVNVNGASISLASYNILAKYRPYFENEEYALFARFQSGYDIYLYTGAYNGLGGGSESQTRVITAYATNRLYRTRPYTIGWNTDQFTGYLNDDLTIVLLANKKDTDSSVAMDWVAFVPRPHVILSGGTVSYAKFAYKGSAANQILNTSYVGKPLNVIGDVVEFVPNKFNHFQCYFCPDETVDPASTYTATFDAIYLTPRFALL